MFICYRYSFLNFNFMKKIEFFRLLCDSFLPITLEYYYELHITSIHGSFVHFNVSWFGYPLFVGKFQITNNYIRLVCIDYVHHEHIRHSADELLRTCFSLTSKYRNLDIFLGLIRVCFANCIDKYVR